MADPDWSPFALLLVDVQRDFWPRETAAAFPGFKNSVASLLDSCRANGIEVVHVQARFKQDRSDWMPRYRVIDRRLPCIEGTGGVEVLGCAAATPGETVILKQSFDAFLNPALDEYLKEKGRRFLFVAGLVTSVCILLTAASAAQKGYPVAVLGDCCADSPGAHEHTLSNYPFIFDISTSAEFIGEYPRWATLLEGYEA